MSNILNSLERYTSTHPDTIALASAQTHFPRLNGILQIAWVGQPRRARGGSDVCIDELDPVFVHSPRSKPAHIERGYSRMVEAKLDYSCHFARTTNYRAPTRFSRFDRASARLERGHAPRDGEYKRVSHADVMK